MLKQTDDQRARAERMFRAREQQKADAPSAMRDYQMAQRATLERMRQLREERLARERQTKKLSA